ncbi:MAG: RluA family pseudouridine synthase [Oscillospiraceae bacterium]
MSKSMSNETSFDFTVCIENVGDRLDSFISDRIHKANTEEMLCQALPVSRTAVQRLIESGNILVNSIKSSKNYKLRNGDCISVHIPMPVELEVLAQDIPLDIIYEDDDLLVVNKAKGMVVHPAPGNSDNTLVNALLYHCKYSLSGINGVLRPGIVHRIDKDTSGLLIVAKNDMAHLSLSKQIAEHSAHRIYNAVVHGNISEDSGTVDRPIGRSERDRKKFCVTELNSKRAVTHFEVLERYAQYTYLKLKLETGRTHQIRVHMAYLGHPVAGDLVYGLKNEPKQLCGQCLHAGEIEFIHPRTGENMHLFAPVPEYFTSFLNGLHR